jgi:hypothetical protein
MTYRWKNNYFCSCLFTLAVFYSDTSLAGQDETVPWYKPKFGDLVTLLGIAVAAVSFWNALRQAREARTWKRKEFMAAQMTEFTANPSVQLVLKILDYTARRLNLTEDEADVALRGVRVDQRLAAAALIPHTLGRNRFSRAEVAIRDAFDVFLERIDKFNDMLTIGLLKIEDITPYIKYWLESIADTDDFLDPALRRSLWLFIDAYEYTGVQKLCQRIQHPILPRADDGDSLKQEIENGDWGASGGSEVAPQEDEEEGGPRA